MSAGLYIHIPFCLRKCPYCDFYSVPMDSNTADAYVEALCGLISSGRFEPDALDTIYFGGGTPSVLGAGRLAKILDKADKAFRIASGAEITFEANPASGDGDIFRALKLAGFNRVSIGAQSALNSELAALGRPHSAEDARNIILSAFEAGFSNISCDLMLAIPSQTPDSLRYSLDFYGKVPVSHISAYLLKIEEGTEFEKKNTAVLCPDEDMAAELYLECVSVLEQMGFIQYEISNFAKPGMESRHNLKYWRCEPYLGLGPSAHSYLGGRRFYFGRDLGGFIRDPLSILLDDGEGGGFDEYAMLRLRLSEGLGLKEAAILYGADTDIMLSRAKPFIESGLAVCENGVLSLTPKGFLVSNTITARILYG